MSQPDTGEQALEIADMLIRSGALDIIVIDSVAALVPRAEIEGEMGDSHVGLQARLMSQALRKITGALQQLRSTTAIFINQLREKIGVMFGCFSYNTRVTLADGTQEKIGKIVNQKLPVEVLSYDPDADADRAEQGRQLVRQRRRPSEFLQFTVERVRRQRARAVRRDRQPPDPTPGGWREAGELLAGRPGHAGRARTVSASSSGRSCSAALMGDGNLSPNRRGRHGVRFRMGHGAKQADYLDWKVSLLGNIAVPRRTDAKGAAFADFTPLPELAELQRGRSTSATARSTSPWDYLKALTPLALAVWYMDDGVFTLRSKGVQAAHRGRQRPRRDLRRGDERGLPRAPRRATCATPSACDVHGRRRGAPGRRRSCSSPRPRRRRFQELVAPYVHPSMDYKLLPRFRGQFAVEPEFVEPSCGRCRRGSSTSTSSRRPVRCTGSTSRSRARTTTSSTA